MKLQWYKAVGLGIILVSLVGTIICWQVKPKQADPVINFRLSLPQASSVIYALRYTTILDAKTANELADLLVAQSNDSTLNKRITPAEQKPKSK